MHTSSTRSAVADADGGRGGGGGSVSCRERHVVIFVANQIADPRNRQFTLNSQRGSKARKAAEGGGAATYLDGDDDRQPQTPNTEPAQAAMAAEGGGAAVSLEGGEAP